jgi:peroxiredoxin
MACGRAGPPVREVALRTYLSRCLRPLLLGLALPATAALAVAPGDPAPGCPLPTLAGDRAVDPAARPGTVVLLDFWASWCPPCVRSFPALEQLQQELGARGFEVIGIGLDETRRAAEAFLERRPVTFTITLDPGGECPRRYGVKGMPSSFLIDRQGRVRQVHTGFRDADVPRLRAHIEALLEEPGEGRP